jgi:hypothetical protein
MESKKASKLPHGRIDLIVPYSIWKKIEELGELTNQPINPRTNHRVYTKLINELIKVGIETVDFDHLVENLGFTPEEKLENKIDGLEYRLEQLKKELKEELIELHSRVAVIFEYINNGAFDD